MKRSLRRFTALALSVMMLIGLMPLDALAAIIKTDVSGSIDLGQVLPMRVIQPVVDTHTYTFMDGAATISAQKVKDGETLLEPETPDHVSGKIFEGWYVGANAVVFGPQAVSSTEEYTASAKYRDGYYVYFNFNGETLATKEVAPNGLVNDDNVNYLITESGSTFGHWSLTPGGSAYNFNTPITADTTLYLVTKAAHRVTFDTQGGTSLLAVYVSTGMALAQPNPVPTKAGYTLTHWSTTPGGAAYNFATPVTAPMTLYAVWTANTNTPYTIVYHIENANDNNFTFESARTRTGTTDSTVVLYNTDSGYSTSNIKADYRNYFRFGSYDTGITIKGDGSTVVNVYFLRNSYTIKMIFSQKDWWGNTEIYISGSGWEDATAPNFNIGNQNYQTDYSFTAKYESDISTKWPTKANVTQNPVRNGNTYHFVLFYGNSTNNSSKRLVQTKDLISSSTNGSTTEYTAQWARQVITYELHYMLQNVAQNGYIDSTLYRQDVDAPNMNWNPKDIDGYKHVKTEKLKTAVLITFTMTV